MSQYWRPAVIVAAICVAYANSLSGPFILDDQLAIVENQQIRQLWSPSVLLPERELPTAGRPIVNASFAANYAAGGLDVCGYHVVNIAVHVACALLLFGLVRRTISDDAGLAVALLWGVHPLNSETVSYVTQRTESLMACFYLLTLYAAAREVAPDRDGRWHGVAIAACAAGMACKESMVTAPLAVVLYERAFVFDSYRDALRSHRRFYLGLALTWILLGALVSTGPRLHSAGFGAGVSPWSYLLNQGEVITHYLRLAVWPSGLAVDYGWPQPVTLAATWPYVLFVGALAAAAVVALLRWPQAGVPAILVFVTLAPTSSILPIATEVGAERRMYLPLGALLALVVGVAAPNIRRVPRAAAAAIVAVVAGALGWQTLARNRDYASPVVLAEKTLEHRPSADAHHWLAVNLILAGRGDEAMPHLRQAVPGAPRAHYTLGVELLKRGQTNEGIAELEAFLREQPQLLEAVAARSMLGSAYAKNGRIAEALAQYRLVLTMNPSLKDRVGAHQMIGDAMLSQGSFQAAAAEFGEVLRLQPNNVRALLGLGLAAMSTDDLARANALFSHVLELDPSNAAAHRNLALVYFDQRNAEAAAPHARRAVELNPNDPIAHDALGRVLAVQGRVGDAIAAFERSLSIDPGYAQAREDLSRLQAAAGRR